MIAVLYAYDFAAAFELLVADIDEYPDEPGAEILLVFQRGELFVGGAVAVPR